YSNHLTSLDVSNAVELINLNCYNNQLSELDLNNNTKLSALDCHNNQLAYLDISNNGSLTSIHCNDNIIKHLKLKVIGNIKNIYAYGSGYIYLDSGSSLYDSKCSVYSKPLTGSTLYKWYDGGISKGNFSNIVLGTITSDTLIAQFNQPSAEFDSNGGNYIADQTANSQGFITAPTAPIKEGCEFLGWYKESACINAWNFATDKVTYNITLYAKWDKNNVHFESLGGRDIEDITNLPFGSKIEEPSDVVRAGYTFNGWLYVADSGEWETWDFDNNTVTHDLTLYANWDLEYDLCLIAAEPNNANYGTVEGSGIFLPGTSVALRATPKAGYRFVCWKDGEKDVSNDNFYIFNAKQSRYLTAEFAAIQTPVLLSAEPSSYKSITLKWTEAPGADKYAIYRFQQSDQKYYFEAYSDTNSYVDNEAGILFNTYYSIKAVYIEGPNTYYSDYSNIKYSSAKVSTPAIEVSVNSYNSLNISWDAIEGATGYAIYRATSSSGTYSLVIKTPLLSYTNTGLTTGTTYYYKVKAYRNILGSDYYSDYSAAKSAKPIPATPTATAVSAGYNSVKISWPAVSGATGYTVYRSDT
ncbi:MAG: InlB B-repeat-containing protein, partial [Eubacteriaceae bacterium]